MEKIFVAILSLGFIFFWPSSLQAQTNFMAQMMQKLTPAPSSDQNNGVEAKAWTDFMRGFISPRLSTSMKIDRIYPTSGRPGTIVTLTGKGFSRTGNKIYTGYGVIGSLASRDGRHLSFKIDFLADLMPNAMKNAQGSESDKVKAMRIPLWIYVENETGLSNNQIFWLKFDPYQR